MIQELIDIIRAQDAEVAEGVALELGRQCGLTAEDLRSMLLVLNEEE